MDIIEFRKHITALAEDDSVPLRKLQAAITSFFKYKYIPHLQSSQTFVVRSSINFTGEVFKNVAVAPILLIA
jgi:hypothetical protein